MPPHRKELSVVAIDDAVPLEELRRLAILRFKVYFESLIRSRNITAKPRRD